MNTIGYIAMSNLNIGCLADEFGRCQKESVTPMDKWDYINLISKISDNYGNELVNMMDKYNKCNLRQITLEEAKEYYKEIDEK